MVLRGVNGTYQTVPSEIWLLSSCSSGSSEIPLHDSACLRDVLTWGCSQRSLEGLCNRLLRQRRLAARDARFSGDAELLRLSQCWAVQRGVHVWASVSAPVPGWWLLCGSGATIWQLLNPRAPRSRHWLEHIPTMNWYQAPF